MNVMASFLRRFQKKALKPQFVVFFICFVSFFEFFGQKMAQNDNFTLSNDILLAIEEYLESADGVNTTDVVEIFERLEEIYQNKLDINNVKTDQLFDLQLLSDIQINNFLNYRNNYGPFISIYELQSIPLFSLETINRILPFISISSSDDNSPFVLKDGVSKADHQILIRTQRNLESLAGSKEENGFLGDPYRHFFRYRLNNGNKLKFGILAEKDVGEEFFSGSNKNGFDFYSYYLSMRDLSKTLSHIVLGDYTVSMGQGLILHNQFGRGLSSFTTNIKKNNGAFRQYTARNEVNYFKGVGVEVSINSNLSSNIFASRNEIDGTIKDLDNDGDFESFSSIDNSGNHRSSRENLKKNQITRSSFGGILKYEKKNSKVGINYLHDHFDKSFQRTLRPDNIFFPRVKSYANLSIDYGHIWRSVNIFGESAYSSNGAFSHLFGALISMDPRLDLSLIYRNYSPKYVSITPNSFGQGSLSQNEKGLYVGIEFRPSKHWIVNAYADHWNNPWLKFVVDSPGTGSDYLLKITYVKKRKINAYLLFKTEEKPRNSRLPTPIDFTVPQRLSKLRLHIGNRLSESIEIRNRAEFSIFKNDLENHQGFLLYQDIIYRSINSPLSLSARLLWFDIEDFDARIYTYENDVLSDFYVPFFSGNGIRYYLNLRYKASRNTTAEFRIAQTRYTDRDLISSGLTEIQGSISTNFKTQIRLRF